MTNKLIFAKEQWLCENLLAENVIAQHQCRGMAKDLPKEMR